MAKAPLSDTISEYLASRKSRGLAKSTIANERVCLRQLLNTTGNIYVSSLTGRHLDMYFAQYAHLSNGTWNRNVTYLRGFFKWCRARRYAPADFDPTEGVGRRNLVPRDFIFLPSSRFKELLEAVDGRDRAVVALGLYSFLRASEMRILTWADIGETHLHVYRPKTSTRDSLPMATELTDELHRWRVAYGTEVGRPPMPHWHVIPARYPGVWRHSAATGRLELASPLRLNPTRPYQKPERSVHKALENIGFTTHRQEGCHTLRRSGGKALYEELAWQRGHDGSLRIVQSMFGHKSIQTTEGYLRLSLERKQRDDLLAGSVMFPEREGAVVEIGKATGGSA